MPDVFTKCTLTVKQDGSHEFQCEPFKDALSEDAIKQLQDPSAIQQPLVWHDVTNYSDLSHMDAEGRIVKQIIQDKYKPDFVWLNYKLGNLAFVQIGHYNPPNIMDVPWIKDCENKAILIEQPYTIGRFAQSGSF